MWIVVGSYEYSRPHCLVAWTYYLNTFSSAAHHITPFGHVPFVIFRYLLTHKVRLTLLTLAITHMWHGWVKERICGVLVRFRHTVHDLGIFSFCTVSPAASSRQPLQSRLITTLCIFPSCQGLPSVSECDILTVTKCHITDKLGIFGIWLC